MSFLAIRVDHPRSVSGRGNLRITDKTPWIGPPARCLSAATDRRGPCLASRSPRPEPEAPDYDVGRVAEPGGGIRGSS